MKKYLVIGNPIEHSLSPKLHNHWIQQNNIDAVYEKKQLNESDIEAMINEIKAENIANMSSFYIALTSMIIGVQLFLAGFIGELISRNSQNRNNYQIEKEI